MTHFNHKFDLTIHLVPTDDFVISSFDCTLYYVKLTKTSFFQPEAPMAMLVHDRYVKPQQADTMLFIERGGNTFIVGQEILDQSATRTGCGQCVKPTLYVYPLLVVDAVPSFVRVIVSIHAWQRLSTSLFSLYCFSYSWHQSYIPKQSLLFFLNLFILFKAMS